MAEAPLRLGRRSATDTYPVMRDGERVAVVWADWQKGAKVPVARGWHFILVTHDTSRRLTAYEHAKYPTRRAAVLAVAEALAEVDRG